MDKKSKILVWSFIVLVIALYSYEYVGMVMRHNYTVFAYTSCDETQHSCFKNVCAESDGTDCEEEVYAKIMKNISDTALCDQYTNECPDLMCEQGESGCEITYCSNENIEDGEVCVQTIAEENPIQEVVDGTSTTTNPDVEQNPL